MLQFITHQTDTISYLHSAELVLKGGCKWVQLRMKEASTEEIKKTAFKVRKLCKLYNATFIIDDHVVIAREVGADGVHLGKNDLPVAEARKIVGNSFIIGGTANTFEDIEHLVSAGADYIGLGPFRFTETKKNLSPVLGKMPEKKYHHTDCCHRRHYGTRHISHHGDWRQGNSPFRIYSSFAQSGGRNSKYFKYHQI